MTGLYKLSCADWNQQHVHFNVFDPSGANCGTLVILVDDVANFIQNSWRGSVFWEGKMPGWFIDRIAVETAIDRTERMRNPIKPR